MNRLSRLLVDPERLPKEHEELYAVGMCAVYSRASDGVVLWDPDEAAERSLLTRFMTPYGDALANLVDERLTAAGAAGLGELHS